MPGGCWEPTPPQDSLTAGPVRRSGSLSGAETTRGSGGPDARAHASHARAAPAGCHGPARPPPGIVSQRSHPQHQVAADTLIICRRLRVICELRLAGRGGWTRRAANGKRALRDGGGRVPASHWLHRYMLGQPEPAPCLHPRRRWRRESCGTGLRAAASSARLQLPAATSRARTRALAHGAPAGPLAVPWRGPDERQLSCPRV